MKKRLVCLLLSIGLLFSLPVQASASAFYRRVQYGLLQSYENLVYDYSIKIYDRFVMTSDEDMGLHAHPAAPLPIRQNALPSSASLHRKYQCRSLLLRADMHA